MEMKVCPKCKKTKEATLQYFQKDKRSASGLTAACRTCTNKYYRDYKKKGLAMDGTNTKGYIPPKEIEIVPIPKVNMFKGHCYSIQTPKRRKEEVGQLIKGTVIQVTDKHITLQTKNYKVSFSLWELSKYKIVEV